MQFTVRDLMTVAPPAVRIDQTLNDALEVVLAECVSELFVVDGADQLLGIVPDFELLKAQMLQSPAETPIQNLMSRPMTTIEADATLEKAAALFRDGRHQRLAVVERGKLLGAITRRDAIRTLHALQAIRQTPAKADTPAAADAANALRGPRFLQHRRELQQNLVTE